VGGDIMIFMVIERFNQNAKAVYDRFREKGRMMPEGLNYVSSWTETNGDRCFQVMECEDPALLESWAANWKDIVEYEFIPVLTSKEMSEKMAKNL
jgi:hypothetical protein